MATNLELKKTGYYAVIIIPPDVRELLGQRKFSKSLGTSLKREAERRAAPILAGWRARIDKARGNGDAVLADAMRWRSILEDLENQGATEVFEDVGGFKSKVAAIEAKHGYNKADEFARVVYSREHELSITHYWKWQEGLDLNNSYHNRKEKDIQKLVAKFHRLDSINHKSVKAWVRDLLASGSTLIVVSRLLVSCRDFWKYITYHDLVPKQDNPFNDVMPPKQAIKTKDKDGSKDDRLPFTREQIVNLWMLAGSAKVKHSKNLKDIIVLAAYTGARINELCTLRVTEVTEDSISVGSKTEAGYRTIPIHPLIKPVIERLKASSKDGYLIPGLTLSSTGDRANYLSQCFHRHKKKLGFSKALVFHSIRKTVATQLEVNGVAEGVAADILGHEKKTMTYGLYSGGSSFESKKTAIETINYPFPEPIL
jgi:integrase